MDKLKEIIGNVVMGHCDGGYIENTTDFINDLTNTIKSNQLGNPKESEQIAEKVRYCYTDKEGRNQITTISSEEAGEMLIELYNKLENFRKATRDLYESNFSE